MPLRFGNLEGVDRRLLRIPTATAAGGSLRRALTEWVSRCVDAKSVDILVPAIPAFWRTTWRPTIVAVMTALNIKRGELHTVDTHVKLPAKRRCPTILPGIPPEDVEEWHHPSSDMSPITRCAFGCDETTWHNGVPRWKLVPDPSPWMSVKPGERICLMHYGQGIKRRKRLGGFSHDDGDKNNDDTDAFTCSAITRACSSPGGICSNASGLAADPPAATATPLARPAQAGHTGKSRLGAIAQVDSTHATAVQCSAFEAWFDSIPEFLAIKDAVQAMGVSTDWAIEFLHAYGLRNFPRKLDRPQGFRDGPCRFIQGPSAATPGTDIYVCRCCNVVYNDLEGVPIAKCFAQRSRETFVDAVEILRHTALDSIRRIDLDTIKAAEPIDVL